MEELFKNIAERLYSENNLSDITWAFMMSCERFKKDFVKFFFGDGIQEICDLRREYQDDDSRPDFFFYDEKNNEYLIEVKIYDRNQHFDQYNNRFPNAEKAFISNYVLTEEEKKGSEKWKRLKHWKKFYEEFEVSVKNYKENDKKLIESYLVFLKSVINYKEINKMNFKEIKSLIDFYNYITDVAKEAGFQTYDKLTSAMNEKQYGRYFFKDDGNYNVAYFWFGLWFEDKKTENNGIWINFDHFNQASWLSQKYQEKIKKMNKNGKNYSDKKIVNGGMWFKLNSESFKDTFCENTDEDKQKTLLKDFFNEVVLEPLQD